MVIIIMVVILTFLVMVLEKCPVQSSVYTKKVVYIVTVTFTEEDISVCGDAI